MLEHPIIGELYVYYHRQVELAAAKRRWAHGRIPPGPRSGMAQGIVAAVRSLLRWSRMRSIEHA